LGGFQKNRFELVVQILCDLVVEKSASHNIIWLMVMLRSWVWLVFLLWRMTAQRWKGQLEGRLRG
jgi:hypothetical protein